MGQVWQAVDLNLGRTVAVKLIRDGQLHSGLLERFRREALAVVHERGIVHPDLKPANLSVAPVVATRPALVRLDGHARPRSLSRHFLQLEVRRWLTLIGGGAWASEVS
ncbi:MULTISPECIES: hypothetical protein [unclassified Frankia]|uniref:hypothetical protein n=1 Tax=unclassified Frankia TaxID=2632575 RepID=UPI002AD43C4C|nr:MULTISPECIES: hypothetical protein [unclassified Frankia]